MYHFFPARFLARRSTRFLDGHGISVQFNLTSAFDGSLSENLQIQLFSMLRTFDIHLIANLLRLQTKRD